MANDWIKMRCDLQTHPKVVRMVSATGADRFRVIGGLHAAWSVFDVHCTDGKLTGYTPELLDQIIGWPGLSGAMLSVGWLGFDGEALVMPEFSEHNGKGAKRRAEDTKGKRERRESAKSPQEVRDMSAKDADKLRSREEKRREEEDQELCPKAAPSDPPADEIAKAKAERAERLAAVTEDAIETFNAAPFTVAHGGRVPNVSAVNREKRRQQVGRSIRVVREICAAEFGSPAITREFWTAYWQIVNRDPFASGRQAGSGAHSNWAPSFEYLTRPDTITAIYERAEAAA